MAKIIKFLTLKKLLNLGLISVVLSVLLYQREIKHLFCGVGGYACYDYVNFIFFITLFLGTLIFFIPLFLLIKKENIFVFWKRFTIIYFLIYLFFIILVPWDWGDVFLPIYKGTVALSLVILYSIISLILIITKSIQLKRNNN